ncbi:methyltransferase domain-containing protein [Hoyosella sp. G463]|uniref:Methyltransferase domain-containing protein n=1 Tax=Lolliginicoccus lacisalsi TaxID=2742202 RepID=A0A927JF02_9ACTN|nr:methyltransferase domain-containing protein [Lolliginicoccus lacisalsi]
MSPLLAPAPASRAFARHASLRRSWSLLRSFRFEQSDPARFYGAVADDTALMLAEVHAGATGRGLAGDLVLDVGGGPGYFSDAFDELGARYVSVEPDASEMHAAGIRHPGSVRGSGMALPIRSDSVDVCFSSNVAEHVSAPWRMADEMVRVVRPGGLVVLPYTLWWGPFGGHETGQWHFLGGELAARRYRRLHGHEPKNRFGVSLFPITAAAGLRWARATTGAEGPAELVAAFPRYNPWWSWWVLRVPVLREVITSNLVLVLRKREQA